MKPDVTITNEGTLFLFALNTRAARAWWNNNVEGDIAPLGRDVYPVEHRYAYTLAYAMSDAGLRLA